MITDSVGKIVGFSSIKNYYSKKSIFLPLLQSIVEFTIPGSTCHIFFKDSEGVIK